ncbi:MAG: D-tyrosyl-tRNA(Tyr) deacylase [Actinobacteria bacterium]|nr:D-tyrosyl-tRNA(Tyr) deacylase [Actinomycetota bacterium]NBY15367.1 D-tyrosyl-tRNA(Tyr) deacylase [Actinomycetota bacterium]
MRAVIQRVTGAAVHIAGQVVGEFSGPGLCVLVGVSVDDDISKCVTLADKIWKLRIFEAGALRAHGIKIEPEKNEVSAADANLPILLISQFTLFADTSRGRRPTWQQAARGEQAEPLINELTRALRDLGASVETGKFGADMQITQTCDGPMTILVEV